AWGSHESVERGGIVHKATKWEVDEEFAKVMSIELTKGRWFDKNDNVSNQLPIVITENVEKEFFENTSGLGHIVTSNDIKYSVVGVCKNARDDPFSISPNGFFTIKSLENMDSLATSKFLIK